MGSSRNRKWLSNVPDFAVGLDRIDTAADITEAIVTHAHELVEALLPNIRPVKANTEEIGWIPSQVLST
jgi:hypothetical protein